MDIRSLMYKAKEVCKRTSEKVISKSVSLIKSTGKYRTWVVIAAAVTVMVMFMSMVLIKRRNIVIYVDGEQVSSFTTLKQETEQWLDEAGIIVEDGDEMTVQDETVHIKKAFYVTVVADGTETSFKTVSCSVKQAIEKSGIEFSEADKVNIPLDDTVKSGDKIVIKRVTNKQITKSETIEFETIKKKTDKLYVGETKVETKGENGKKEYVYEVVYTDGKETDRKLVSETVIKEPVDKVVLVGTKEIPKVTTSSTPSNYKKVITMKASAYTYGEDGGNITATGIRPYKGIVAVDPKVIPLGTKLYIETSDGSYIYGTAVAADVGGAIKGNKIDLFLNSESECRRFGRRNVNVYIIG